MSQNEKIHVLLYKKIPIVTVTVIEVNLIVYLDIDLSTGNTS